MANPDTEQVWRGLLQNGEFTFMRRWRPIFSQLPSDPRCKICHAPFRGLGGTIARSVFKKRPSQFNPKFCNTCEDFAREYPGGAEGPMAMLFTDVRGSTTLAEKMSPSEFGGLINRFYRVATQILTGSDALIEKLAGDSVTALYFPGFAGPDYAGQAVRAAQELARATGYTDPEGPWIQIGIGVHAGVAFAGTVGSKDGMSEFAALGDAMNVAARLCSQAAAGEILVSEEACNLAKLNTDGIEQRHLSLKGRSEQAHVRVIRAA